MAPPQPINVAPAVATSLAAATRGTQAAAGLVRSLSETHASKFAKFQEHKDKTFDKISKRIEFLWTGLGFILLIHGSQFKNLFLCTQVIYEFCFGRVKSSYVSLYDDLVTAWGKMNEGEGDDSKEDADAPESKHAQKRASKKDDGKSEEKQKEEDVATAKKLVKAVNSDKVTSAVFELCAASMACHMVMEDGLANKVLLAHMLTKTTKQHLQAFLDFADHDDMRKWLDLFLSFVLYIFFGGMTVVATPMALALNLAMVGAQIVLEHGLRIAEKLGKIPGGEKAEDFAGSVKGFIIFGVLTGCGTLYQFWALLADSGVAWYFQMFYFPAYFAESFISLL